MVTENIQKFSDAFTTIENSTTEASDITDLEGYSGAKIISSLQQETEIFCDEDRAYL